MMNTVPASVYIKTIEIQEKIANGEIVVDSYLN